MTLYRNTYTESHPWPKSMRHFAHINRFCYKLSFKQLKQNGQLPVLYTMTMTILSAVRQHEPLLCAKGNVLGENLPPLYTNTWHLFGETYSEVSSSIMSTSSSENKGQKDEESDSDSDFLNDCFITADPKQLFWDGFYHSSAPLYFIMWIIILLYNTFAWKVFPNAIQHGIEVG